MPQPRLALHSAPPRVSTRPAPGRPTVAVATRNRRYRRSLAVADAVSALVALLAVADVAGGRSVNARVLLGLPLVIGASKLAGLYDRDHLVLRKTTLDEAPALFQLAGVYTLVVWMADDLVTGGPLSSAQALGLWMALWIFGLMFRHVARTVAARAVETERVLVIGDAATCRRLQHKLDTAAVHAEIVGRLAPHRVSLGAGQDHQVDEVALRALVYDLDVHRVVVAPNQLDRQATCELVRAIGAAGVRASLVPHVLDVVGSSVVFDELDGMSLLGVRDFGLSRSSLAIKRAFDVVGAGVCLLAMAPLIVLIAVAIKADTRGPVFFRQERVGRAGRRFRIFKFRTMVADAEARKLELQVRNEAQGLFKIAGDPRITRVGRLLRRTSLDEMPQLVNVLLGEMSLVGPRPLIVSEDETITGYDRRRLDLMPGMTGHWQILGSARVPLHEMVKIDYLYVMSWSLFGDLKILVRTARYVLAGGGM